MASFLHSFFKPKWQHEQASVRLEAIKGGLSKDILEQLALSDSNQEVQQAAIKHITDLDSLSALFGTKSVRPHVITQYLSIALGSEQLTEQLIALKSITDTNTLMTIASEASDTQLVEAALNEINDEITLFEYILQAASAKARQLAIQNVNDLEKLKTIETQFRNKDKTLVRIAKGKIQAAQELEDKRLQDVAHTEQLHKQALALAEQAFNPEYVAKLTYLKQQWQTALHKDALNGQFEQAIAICETIAKENAEAQQALEQEKENNLKANEQYLSILKQAQSLFNEAKSRNNLKSDDISPKVKQLQQDWIETQSLHKADKALQADYNDLIKSLINLDESLTTICAIKVPEFKDSDNLQQLTKDAAWINKTQRSINWPTDFAQPQVMTTLSEHLDRINQRISKLKDSEKDAISKISRELSELENSISEGNLKHASKLANQLKKLFHQVDAKKVNSQNQQFQLLQKQLHDLQDWKGFAALPKFESLVEDMKALQNSELGAKELSKQIHTLQEEWKALGSLGDKSKQTALWNEFKAAADIAYEPCKAFYDDQSKIRQFNKEQRELICSELETLNEQQDWESANFKALQKIIDKAHSEYKKFAPVDRSVNKALQQRFNDALSNLKNKLNGYYQNNVDDKQAIINRCIELVELEDLSAAIEQCKHLQQDWKTIENAGRQENELWTQFREACDNVFARRTAQNQAKRAETDAKITEAESLLSQAKQLADQADASLLSSIDEFKTQIEAIDIPVKVKAAISKQVSQAKESLKKSVSQQKQAAEQQKWQDAIALSDKLAEAEPNGLDSEQANEWINGADLPKGAKDSFLKRIQLTSSTDADTLSNLCLELEISLGLETPAEDRDKRMAYQVQLLQQNMGKPSLPRHELLKQLQLQWFELSAHDQNYGQYRQRFFNGIEQASGQALETA